MSCFENQSAPIDESDRLVRLRHVRDALERVVPPATDPLPADRDPESFVGDADIAEWTRLREIKARLEQRG